MTDITSLIERLVAAGADPIVAACVVAEAVVAGVHSAEFRGIPPDSAAEKRRAYDRERKRNSTGIPPESTGIPETPLSISKNIKKVERQNRGSRISADWSATDAERSFAKQQGYTEFEVLREIDKFRDYWTACAGAKGVKLDWSATWRQWVRNGAERAGKAPTTPGATAAPGGVYATFASEERDAWDCYGRESRGKSYPRDKTGGWTFPTRWPPGYTPLANHDPPPPAPIVRAM